MKHVWLLNHYAQEPGGPGGTRHYSLATHLPAHGWRASIIAASVEHNTGRQRIATREATRRERFGNVDFLWLRTPTHTGNGFSRMANILIYTLRALHPGVTRALDPPDAIVGSSVHPLAAVAGAILARRHSVPFLFEVRDLWPETLIDMGRIRRNSLVAWGLAALEKWLYRRAVKIIVLLPQAHAYIAPLGIDPAKIAWIPNGVELDPAGPTAYPHTREPFTLMYFGAHGDANGIDTMLRAFQILKARRTAPRLRLRLIGNGPRKPGLVALARDLDVTDHVTFEPPVPKTAIPALASKAHAFVFNLIDAPVFKYGISSNKLFDYLAAGRPIVFCCNASNNPVDEAGAGVSTPSGDPAALADAIERLADMPTDALEQMGLAGFAYVSANHKFSILAERLAQTLDTVVHPAPG
jgi:glycosyltransferase involved in cell wall biosynthesis